MPECSTCGAPATSVTRRRATGAEADAHWDAREAWRRSGAHPEPGYVQDRSGDVEIPVYACDEHAMTGDAAHLLHDADCGGHDACACTDTAT